MPFTVAVKCLAGEEETYPSKRNSISIDGYSMVDTARRCFQRNRIILNMVSADTSTPGWFQLRTTATKKILDRMNDEEKKTLEDEADRMEKDGLPRDVQRK